jgi:DNA-binding NtrC family response regulator
MHFLLLHGAVETAWKEALKQALVTLGELESLEVDQIMNYKTDEKDQIFIVDATTVDRVEKVVSDMRKKNPERRIVVMTSSPTWQNARAAFEAGAIDYLPKDLGEEEIRTTFREIGQKPLPPWPR